MQRALEVALYRLQYAESFRGPRKLESLVEKRTIN